jgi:hypothetical protein
VLPVSRVLRVIQVHKDHREIREYKGLPDPQELMVQMVQMELELQILLTMEMVRSLYYILMELLLPPRI